MPDHCISIPAYVGVYFPGPIKNILHKSWVFTYFSAGFSKIRSRGNLASLPNNAAYGSTLYWFVALCCKQKHKLPLA